MASRVKRPSYPSPIRVLGKPYRLEAVPSNGIADGSYGSCEDGKQRICIAADLPPELEQDTVLHELLHAIDYAMQLKLSERQISALASGLMALISDNPDLAQYLLRK